MNSNENTDGSSFDTYAEDYDCALERGIGITGEGKDYFASGRVRFLSRILSRLKVQTNRVLDYGCGTGSATPYLRELLHADAVQGVDPSAKSIDRATRSFGGDGARFLTLEDYQPDESFDLAYCNGVFHHIPLEHRLEAVQYVHRSLRPGGLFAFWENNPWNLGTQIVMARIPFDRDAIKLSPITSRRLLRSAGFDVIKTSFLFIFPKSLAWLRPIENGLSSLPIGGQYQVLCRKK